MAKKFKASSKGDRVIYRSRLSIAYSLHTPARMGDYCWQNETTLCFIEARAGCTRLGLRASKKNKMEELFIKILPKIGGLKMSITRKSFNYFPFGRKLLGGKSEGVYRKKISRGGGGIAALL